MPLPGRLPPAAARFREQTVTASEADEAAKYEARRETELEMRRLEVEARRNEFEEEKASRRAEAERQEADGLRARWYATAERAAEEVFGERRVPVAGPVHCGPHPLAYGTPEALIAIPDDVRARVRARLGTAIDLCPGLGALRSLGQRAHDLGAEVAYAEVEARCRASEELRLAAISAAEQRLAVDEAERRRRAEAMTTDQTAKMLEMLLGVISRI